MTRATLRRLLWICSILAVNVGARIVVSEREKHSPFVNRNYDLCEDIQCLAVEDIFMQTVDIGQTACKDYFKYACHKNYTGSSDHDAFSREPSQVLEDLKDILDRDVLGELDAGNYALEIERTIWQRCKEGEAFSSVEKSFYEVTVLARSNANRLLLEYEYTQGELSNWDATDLKYALQGFGFTFFDIEIYQPHDDPNDRYILVKPPPNEISQLLYLLSQRFDSRSRGSYRKFDKYGKLKDFMDKLSGIIPGSTEPTTSDVRKFTVGDWSRKYEAHVNYKCAKIDWLNYLSKLFAKVQQTVRSETIIAVQSEQYFYSLAGVLSRINDVDVIADFVHLHFVSKSIGLVDSSYPTYSILPQIDGLLCTPGLLAGTLYKYADQYFSADSRRELEVLTLKVRDEVVNRIKQATVNINMGSGPSTARSNLQQHMNNIAEKYTRAKIYFGYPEWLMNATTAYRLYGTRKNRYSKFYESQAYIIEQLLLEKLQTWKQSEKPIIDLKELTKGLESKRIEIDIASELPAVPEILIPFGYFSEKNYKFFSSRLFDCVNYGAAAAEVAFNLYYALIDSILGKGIPVSIPRCIRDKVPSNVRDRDAFAKRAMAYVLALDTAYEAWPSKHSRPIQFVDFGAMADTDVFFLSFAKSLCTIPPEVSNHPEERNKKKSYRIDDYYTLSHHIRFAMEHSEPFAENYLCHERLKSLRHSECDPLKFEFTSS